MAVPLCQHIQARRSRRVEEVRKTGRRVNMYGNYNKNNNKQSWHFTVIFVILGNSLCLMELMSSFISNSSQSKTLRCPVFHIKAPIPANSYIVIPKNVNHSLGLTGRYFYLLFRPHPGKYFVVHLDVCSKVLGRIFACQCVFGICTVSRDAFSHGSFPSPTSTCSLWFTTSRRAEWYASLFPTCSKSSSQVLRGFSIPFNVALKVILPLWAHPNPGEEVRTE